MSFDTCAKCKYELGFMSKWESHDYAMIFKMECDQCGQPLEVTVHQVPEFSTEKLKCQMCNKVELASVRADYCEACAKKLSDLSDYNAASSK